MSKIQSAILGVFLFLLSASVGYVQLQVVALKTAWQQSAQSQWAAADSSTNWSDEVTHLKDTIRQQQKELEALKSDLSREVAELETSVRETYLPKSPVFELQEEIFTYNDSALTSQASAQTLTRWKDSNQFYLNEILEKSLSLTYDPAGRGAVVDEVLPQSIFDQMGLKTGDRIVSYNGQPVTRATNIRQKLLEPQNGKIVINRNNQNLNLALSYVDNNTPPPATVATTPAKPKATAAKPKPKPAQNPVQVVELPSETPAPTTDIVPTEETQQVDVAISGKE